jgi:hypothetical protein
MIMMITVTTAMMMILFVSFNYILPSIHTVSFILHLPGVL